MAVLARLLSTNRISSRPGSERARFWSFFTSQRTGVGLERKADRGRQEARGLSLEIKLPLIPNLGLLKADHRAYRILLN
jgi:hypothetical protein